MPNKPGHDIKVYLSLEEAAWVKSQGRGYIRKLVQADMGQEPDPRDVPEKEDYALPYWARQ